MAEQVSPKDMSREQLIERIELLIKEKKIECENYPVKIAETLLIVTVYKDVFYFRDTKGEFLGLIKTKA